ncbi:MAG TPA: NAD(P)-dependent oxidoreductase, partial [Pseudobdellovibrionaceae bacterium]|nr:NAD(P)-dependent oxidoreductase [Pseudobdellovibrionaceae bacterium]
MSKVLVTGGSGFIGTNLIEFLCNTGHQVCNIDIAPPLCENQLPHWKKCNILDLNTLSQEFLDFSPDVIVHLAARTDTESSILSDYDANITGTKNIIEAARKLQTLKRLIITSTQYVYKSASFPFPASDTTFEPHTVYGQSKVLTEKLTRESGLNCCWTIIRPANIWGPWHLRYPKELWKVIGKGYYVHPSKKPVIRTYGYVKNVVYQIQQIFSADEAFVNHKTFYVGDLPCDSFTWLNEISIQLNQKNILRVPAAFIGVPALLGDLLKKFGIKSPIHSTRYKNMIEDYYAPTNATVSLFGASHPNLSENVKETIDWISSYYSPIDKFWKSKIP